MATGLQEIDAGANACSVEWCPIAGLESYVACSTYLLESASGDAAADTDAAVGGLAGQESAEKGKGEEVQAGSAKGQTRSGSIVVHKVGVFAPSTGSYGFGVQT